MSNAPQFSYQVAQDVLLYEEHNKIGRIPDNYGGTFFVSLSYDGVLVSTSLDMDCGAYAQAKEGHSNGPFLGVNAKDFLESLQTRVGALQEQGGKHLTLHFTDYGCQLLAVMPLDAEQQGAFNELKALTAAQEKEAALKQEQKDLKTMKALAAKYPERIQLIVPQPTKAVETKVKAKKARK